MNFYKKARGLSKHLDKTLVALASAEAVVTAHDAVAELESVKASLDGLLQDYRDLELLYLNRNVKESEIESSRLSIRNTFIDRPSALIMYETRLNLSFFSDMAPAIRYALVHEVCMQATARNSGYLVPKLWQEILSNDGYLESEDGNDE